MNTPVLCSICFLSYPFVCLSWFVLCCFGELRIFTFHPLYSFCFKICEFVLVQSDILKINFILHHLKPCSSTFFSLCPSKAFFSLMGLLSARHFNTTDTLDIYLCCQVGLNFGGLQTTVISKILLHAPRTSFYSHGDNISPIENVWFKVVINLGLLCIFHSHPQETFGNAWRHFWLSQLEGVLLASCR